MLSLAAKLIPVGIVLAVLVVCWPSAASAQAPSSTDSPRSDRPQSIRPQPIKPRMPRPQVTDPALIPSPSDLPETSFAEFLRAFDGPDALIDGDQTGGDQIDADQIDGRQAELLPSPPGLVDPDAAAIAGSNRAAADAAAGSSGIDADGNSPIEPDSPLTLADVIASLYRSYPDVVRARLRGGETAGDFLSAQGAYDTKFEAYSLSEPLGFYETYRNGLSLARQTWWGGYAKAGYRIGRGNFEPWYKERQTDHAGEFKYQFGIPLLQGRAIDPFRVQYFQTNIQRQTVQPEIQRTLLEASRDATSLYWQWVATGAVLQAQQQLLDLAERRLLQYEIGVAADLFAEIDLIFNQQFVAERQIKVFETRQKYQQLSIKLSLYLRNPAGQPLLPLPAWLPEHFPVISQLPPGDLQQDIADALTRRPEPQLILLERRQRVLDRQLACNQMLPQLDFVVEASQDMGERATSTNDKGEFELELGIVSQVPIQRRKARGKVQSTTSKIAQLDQKLRFQQNKIQTELETAQANLRIASEIVEQAEISLRAALDTLQRYRSAFDIGKVDLIYLNLLETKANETEIKLVDAQRQWFESLAEMQIALGLDPLEQAINVTRLPASDRPGPGTMPALDVEAGEEEVAEQPAQ